MGLPMLGSFGPSLGLFWALLVPFHLLLLLLLMTAAVAAAAATAAVVDGWLGRT
jgi:hypothetical protein